MLKAVEEQARIFQQSAVLDSDAPDHFNGQIKQQAIRSVFAKIGDEVIWERYGVRRFERTYYDEIMRDHIFEIRILVVPLESA